MEPPGKEKGWTCWEVTGLVPGEGGMRSRDPARLLLTFSYSSSSGLCFCSQSASGRSLKEPVTPCSTWIFRRVSALGIISTIPGSVDSRVRPIHPTRRPPRPQPLCHQPSHHHCVTACKAAFLQTGWWEQIQRDHNYPQQLLSSQAPGAPVPSPAQKHHARGPDAAGDTPMPSYLARGQWRSSGR